jgi:hypothetical protein
VRNGKVSEAAVVRKLSLAETSRGADVTPPAARSQLKGASVKSKRDFDATTLVPWNGAGGDGVSGGPNGTTEERLVVFKSGSQPGLRDSVAIIEPKTGAVAAYNAISLMAALRADARVTGRATPLNIKAATTIDGGLSLALFNCGRAPGGVNSVVVMRLNDFFRI